MAVSITCLCGGVALSVHLDPSADHTQLELCHCNSCRLVTGLICTSYYLLQYKPALHQVQEYREFPQLSRFFCASCGCHVFARSGKQYLLASGTLVAEDAPPVQSIQHWKVDDTRDGGLSTFLSGPTTNNDCRLKAVGQEETTTHEELSELPNASTSPNELHARCHCGGIEFFLTRPDKSSFQASSPWPDLLVPYHSKSAEYLVNIKWWLRARGTKYLAGTCACPSCRLGSGFPIQAWAFVPKSNIFHAGYLPLEFNRGATQQYVSSPGVYREFCGRCGATVFWHNDGRPTLIDVSVGLLQGDGAKALSWLDWASDRVSFSEMAIQKDLVSLLEKGLRKVHV